MDNNIAIMRKFPVKRTHTAGQAGQQPLDIATNSTDDLADFWNVTHIVEKCQHQWLVVGVQLLRRRLNAGSWK